MSPKAESESLLVHIISKSSIKPKIIPEESKKPYYLTPWDLAMFNAQYIQKGLLFSKPSLLSSSSSNLPIIDHLKNSFSMALSHFFPLAGRLVTTTNQQNRYHVFIDVDNSPGAEFIHAVSNHLKVSDIINVKSSSSSQSLLSLSEDVHPVLNSFFPHREPVLSHDGHVLPLVTAQVTELIDGIFIGCSFNHVVGDGTSYWNFFNAWSEISRSFVNDHQILSSEKRPITKRLFIISSNNDQNNHDVNDQLLINLPFAHHDEFIERLSPSEPLQEKIFHFSAESMKRLKARANDEIAIKNCRTDDDHDPEISINDIVISSFKALSALMWRAITRARRVALEDQTICRLAFNSRTRIRPQVPGNYFGNCIQAVGASTRTSELLENNMGWAARLLHEAVASHTDEKVREWVEGWMKKPTVYKLTSLYGGPTVNMGSSPWFDMYGNDFGWGKPIGVRSGYGNKFDGKVTSYQGREGGRSVDLEVCLFPQFMKAFEADEELIQAMV